MTMLTEYERMCTGGAPVAQLPPLEVHPENDSFYMPLGEVYNEAPVLQL